MKLNVKIENLGKLSHADIQIRNFTVFAGLNNTGKTYVSKMLYSILNVMRNEHWGEMPSRKVFRTEQSLKRVVEDLPDTVEGKEEFADEAKNHLKKMYALFRVANEKIFDQKLERMDATLEERKETANKILSLFKEFKDKLPAEESKEPSARDSRFWRLRLDRLESNLADLSRTASENAEQLVRGELSEDFSRNLRGNFAIKDESSLRYSGKETATISCEDLGTFSIDESGGTVECPVENIRKFQEFPKQLIYLESPVYWKMKDALEVLRFRRRRARGVPRYFYDLMAELRETEGEDSRPISHWYELHEQVSDAVAQQPFISSENPRQIDLFHDITKAIGGKLVVSDESELLFQENGREYPLSVAAMGVVNYGMLGLLMERGIIDETTFLFMDEPEAHLHPRWQVKIARTLFELAKLGIHVIIATHSVDILKWLKVEIKENPASEEIIALNHFSTEGKTIDHEEDLKRKLAAITAELAEPFFNLYMRDL